MADYYYWENALAGTFGPVHDGDPQPGFYRKRTGKSAGYVPVAIWYGDGRMLATVDGKAADPCEIWTFVCQYPILERWYRDRMAGQPWPDMDSHVEASLAPPSIGHNEGPTDEAEVLKVQIDAASAGVAEYTTINDDAASAKAQSLRSRLLELSGEADKKREVLVRPHLDGEKAVNKIWMPLVKEAKAAADAIRAANSAYETRKLRAAEKAAAEAAEVLRKSGLEAAKLAADAEKAGKPIPVPEPLPPPPAPATTIRGAYGRAASKRLVKVARVVDQDKAYLALRTHKEMIELIATLAQRAATAGIPVDGVEVIDEVKTT